MSLTTDRPVVYDDIAEHFKYGSIGSEPGGSLLAPVGGVLPPYQVFKALPAICSDRLPGGYASVGLIFEPGRDLPIGVSRRRRLGHRPGRLQLRAVPYEHRPRLADARRRASCWACRRSSSISSRSCSSSSIARSTAGRPRDSVAGRFKDAGGRVSLFERLLMRVGLIDRLKVQTLDLRNRIEPILSDRLPRWGRGRVDTFNPYKAIQFNWRLDQLPASRADRRGGLSAALESGAARRHAPALGRQQHLGRRAQPERRARRRRDAGDGRSRGHQARSRLDLDAAAAGVSVSRSIVRWPRAARRVYQQSCLECHAGDRFRDGVKEGARVGQVEDIDRIATDPHRLDSYTDEFAANQYALYPESQYRFTHFRKTHGYANQPLDGIWLRGPYLHNGSVPTLRDLLEPPERRPAVFYRGYDVFDQTNVGFVSNVPAADGRDIFPVRHRAARATATADTCTARHCRMRTSGRSSSTEDVLTGSS